MTFKTHQTSISIAALLTAMTLSSPALSQDVSADTNAGVSVSTDGTDANVEGSGSASASADNEDTDANVDAGGTASASASTATTDLNGNARVSTITDGNARTDAMANLSAGGSIGDTTFSSDTQIDDTRVSIFDAEDNLGAEGATSLSTRLSANGDGLGTLRSNISNNTQLSAVLENAGVDVDDVIGVQVAADGSVDVFVADGVLNSDCGTTDFNLSGSMTDEATISAANNVLITALSGCQVENAAGETTIVVGALEQNATATAKLETRGFDMSDVVAVTELGENTINIYVERDS